MKNRTDKMLFNVHKNSGITLIGTVASIAIGTVALFVIAKLYISFERAKMTSLSRSYYQEMVNEVTSLLKNEDQCTLNFSGKEIDINDPGFQSHPPDYKNLEIIRQANPKAAVSIVAKEGLVYGKMELTELKLKLTGKSGDTYFAKLHMKGEIPANDLSRSPSVFPSVKSIPILLETQPLKNPNKAEILSCTSSHP